MFDCLLLRGEDIRLGDRDNRLKQGFTYKEELSIESDYPMEILSIVAKGEHPFSTVEEFFKAMYILNDINFIKSLPYDIDGIILTPNNHPYKIVSDFYISTEKRNISENPSVIKWKSAKDTTIDFRIVKGETITLMMTNKIIQTGEESMSSEIEFRGTDRNPFDYKTQLDETLLIDIDTGTIAEFAFVDGKLTYFKPRNEKLGPNAKVVAESNWDNINNPITIDTITGNDFRLMFKYHNRIKFEMLNQFNGTLLDLGSGRGGDITKWNNYRVVICVENNRDNIVEFRKRILHYGKRLVEENGEVPHGSDSYIVLMECSLMETERIVKQVKRITNNSFVDVVSLMDVGTFLWKDLDTLQRSMKTIDGCLTSGGHFVWKMMDGNSVRSIIDPYYGGKYSSDDNTLRIGKFTLEYKFNSDRVLMNEINVNIPGTILGLKGQEEYLTNITEMENILQYTYVGEKKIANNEPFMGEDAKALSSLYSYAVMKKPGEKAIIKKRDLSTISNPLSEKTISETRPKQSQTSAVAGNIRTAMVHSQLLGYQPPIRAAPFTSSTSQPFTSSPYMVVVNHSLLILHIVLLNHSLLILHMVVVNHSLLALPSHIVLQPFTSNPSYGGSQPFTSSTSSI